MVVVLTTVALAFCFFPCSAAVLDAEGQHHHGREDAERESYQRGQGDTETFMNDLLE
jgi:hypothetical protein